MKSFLSLIKNRFLIRIKQFLFKDTVRRTVLFIVRIIFAICLTEWLIYQLVPKAYEENVALFSYDYILITFTILLFFILYFLRDSFFQKLSNYNLQIQENPHIANIWKKIFLVSLCLFLLFIYLSFINNTTVITIKNQFKDLINLLIFIILIFFILLFYFNYEKIIKSVVAEQNKEKFSEQSRKNKLNDSFLINKIPILRSLVESLYKESWIYVLSIIFCLLILILLSFPLLSRLISDDEFHLFSVAKGLIETRKCVTWNFLYDMPSYIYKNSCFISLIISIFYLLFGVSIFSAKIFFILLSLVNVFLLYALVKKMVNKKIALLLTIFYCTNPFFIYQSSYIRAYIFLITVSLIIFHLLLKFLNDNKNVKKNIIRILIILSLIFLGYKLRATFITFLPIIILFILIKIYFFIKTKSQKIKRIYYGFILITVSILTYLFIFLIRQYKGVFKSGLNFDWHTFNITFFKFDPQIAKIIFFLLFLLILFTIKKVNKSNKQELFYNWKINIFSLFILLISSHTIFSLFIDQTSMLPRYAIHLILLNFVFLTLTLYFILLCLIKNKSFIYILLFLILLGSNLSFWGTYRINDNWGSQYNYIDMYDLNSSTTFGRLKPNYIESYEIIKNYIRPEDKKIALIIEPINDYQIKTLIPYKDKIVLICPRWLPYEFMDIIMCDKENYITLDNKAPLKKEVLKKYIYEYDRIFFVYPTRKSYKYQSQKQYLEEDFLFKKISGQGIDNTNVEIYYWKKD